MSFYINTDQIGDVAVLQCAGRMVRAQGLSLLRDAVISLSQLRVIVLDLSEVDMLDAGGLGLLVSLHNWACENGIQLKLANPSKLVREMLELTGLASVLRISSVDDLIEIFCNPEGFQHCHSRIGICETHDGHCAQH
jgi:anti-anti-sigma factor